MTKINTCSELRYLTLAELRTLQIDLGRITPGSPEAGLCSPASKASAAPWRRTSPGSRSRMSGRLGLVPNRRVLKPS